ncbi:MAG: flagellar biosynthesis protein FliQ [Pseudomonadota bacterium]|nr:flagellar biosynthesis protein FliQ [Pseudomonadota bacterium]
MEPEQVLDVARLSLSTLMYVSGPSMIVALVVGLVIALFQALTSIQEVTLTFVPKILLVFLAILLTLPFMADQLNSFANEIFSMIAGSGSSIS